MNLLVLVLLTVLWASILVPGAVRGRHDRSPTSSINSFERSMGILASETRGRLTASSPGRHIMVVHDPQRLVSPASRRARILARRRTVLHGLIASVATTGILALVVRGPALTAFGLSAAALTAYVGVLAQLRAQVQQTRRTVRRLPVARAGGEGVPQQRAAAGEQSG